MRRHHYGRNAFIGSRSYGRHVPGMTVRPQGPPATMERIVRDTGLYHPNGLQYNGASSCYTSNQNQYSQQQQQQQHQRQYRRRYGRGRYNGGGVGSGPYAHRPYRATSPPCRPPVRPRPASPPPLPTPSSSSSSSSSSTQRAQPIEHHVHHHYHCPDDVVAKPAPSSSSASTGRRKDTLPPLCPTVPDTRSVLLLKEVFGRCEPRPNGVSILGKNYTCARDTVPRRENVKKRFNRWRTYIYIPHECHFVYVPLYLYFCATPHYGSAGGSTSSHQHCPGGVSGVIRYQWLLNRRCGVDPNAVEDSEKECEDELDSVVRMNDVDAPSFFIESGPPESTYLERRENCSSRTTAELRPLDLQLAPEIVVCDSDCDGALLSVCFSLTIVNHSPRYEFCWQVQVGDVSPVVTSNNAVIQEVQSPPKQQQ